MSNNSFMRKGFCIIRGLYDKNVQGGIHMNDISNIYSKVGAAYGNTFANSTKDAEKAEKSNSGEAVQKTKVPGKTIGNPKLSEKAQKYYEELKSKYHNMDFILVSEDQKEKAKSQAASYAQGGKMVVLIDEDKIEKMAEDSSYRAQYEGIIEKASAAFYGFKDSITATGANVKGFGMQVNDDGTTSFFAVLEKSSEAQAKRIAEKRAEAKAEKKAEAKKAAKKEAEERIEKARESKSSEKINPSRNQDMDDVVITANSIEELLQKIQDHVQLSMSDNVVTESEKVVGQNIDFKA